VRFWPVMSCSTPTVRSARRWPSTTPKKVCARARIQRSPPSGRTMRYSLTKWPSPAGSLAARAAATCAARSSGTICASSTAMPGVASGASW